MQIPLSFAVVYNGLIAGRTNRARRQKDAFNILIKGVDSFENRFAESHVSSYVKGAEEIPKEDQEIFLSLSDEEIINRLRIIGIDRIETTVKMFHDFYIKTVEPDTEKKKILKTLIESEMYEQYIVSALRFSFDYTGKQKEWMSSTIVKTLRELSKISGTSHMKIEPNGFCNIPHRNDYFVGRKEEKLMIEANFRHGKTTQIIYGMGGMGKSQLAADYAYDHRSEYSTILWINAETPDTIISRYINYLKQVRRLPEKMNREIVSDIFINLAERSTGWLLIYDNCDYYEQEEFNSFIRLLPREQNNIHILITQTSHTETRLNPNLSQHRAAENPSGS